MDQKEEGQGSDEQGQQEQQNNQIVQESKEEENIQNETPNPAAIIQNCDSQPQVQNLPQVQETAPQNQSAASSFFDNVETLANYINGMDSQILLQRAPLETLINLLQIAQPSEFDDVKDPQSLMILIEQQYHKKKSDLETIIYHVMKGYDELNQKVNLNQLEKIMRILKSKNKSIYITKDDSLLCQCLCTHHKTQQNQNEHTNEDQQENKEVPKQENEIKQEQQKQEEQPQESQEIEIVEEKNVAVQEIQQEESQQIPAVISGEIKEEIDVQTQQLENTMETQLELQKKLVEQYERQIEENQINLQAQEEQVDSQIQQIEEQPQPTTQQELEENVEQLRDSIQRSREQIEKLTEQRDALLQQSRELAERQLELRLQQQQILNQLQQTEEVEESKTISCNDIFGIMTLNNLNLNQLQHYNGQTNSLIFKLNKNYTVEIKSDDSDQPRVLNKDSQLNQLPLMILNRFILPYLSALELFKLRGVCGWFKEQVKQTWPIVFKREMFEQLLARDLMKNIFTFQRLQILKTTLFYKIHTLIDAIIHVTDWDQLNTLITTNTMEIDIYRPVLGMLSLFNKQQDITYSFQIDGTFPIQELAQDLKTQISQYLHAPFLPLTFNQMRKLNDNMLSAPEFSIEFLRNNEDKLPLYLTILVQLLYFHGLIHQTFVVEEFQLKKWKQEQAILDQRQTYNQNFLEGAYKKLLLRNCQDEQEEEVQQEENNSDANEAAQFLRALTNLVPTENPEPDIVIRRNRTVTKIYIDINTKLDILVQTIEQYKITKVEQPQQQKPQQQQQVDNGLQCDMTEKEQLESQIHQEVQTDQVEQENQQNEEQE